MKPETRSKKMTVRKGDSPTTVFAKRDMDRRSISQKQRQAQGKQQGFSRSTPEKQGTSQRPFTEKQRAERKTSSSAITMQKQTEKYSEIRDGNREYNGKQPDTKTTRSFDRYQPYSKQKRSDASVAKRYTKPSTSNPGVKRNSEKTTLSNKSRASLQNSERQEPRRAYTSRGNSTPSKKSRQAVSVPKITKRQASGSLKSGTPPKRESQSSYVSRGSNASQYSGGSGGRSSRGLVSGSGYKSQPNTGVSRGTSRALSMGLGRR